MAAATALLLLLGGCAEIAPDAGFATARNAAQDQLGADLVWQQSLAQDPAVHARVQALLAEPLTAERAVAIALINNPQLQAAFEEIGIAQGDLVQAGLLANPSLDLSLLFASPRDVYSGTIIEDFLALFTRAARTRIAGEALDKAAFLVASKVIDHAAEVRAAYYTLVADQQALALLRQATDATAAAAELAERQRRAGNIAGRDQALQQQLYAGTLLQQARLDSDLFGARETLNRLLGLWGEDTGWTVPDRLPETMDEIPATPHLESLALANRLDLAAARKDVALAADMLGFTRDYRFLQSFGVGFAYERDIDAEKRGPVLQLVLPLFDQGQGRIRQQEAELRQKARLFEAMAIELRSKVREAAARLAAAKSVIAHYKTALLPLNQSIIGESVRLYNGMLLSVYELLSARQTQLGAARDYIDALKDYWLARTELERLVGGRFEDKAS